MRLPANHPLAVIPNPNRISDGLSQKAFRVRNLRQHEKDKLLTITSVKISHRLKMIIL